MTWRITDPNHLLGAVRTSLMAGGRYLTNRLAPLGPILKEPNLTYVAKASWGMYCSGVDHDVLARMFDWVQREALQKNGDVYCPGERPEYKDLQRVYRPMTFGKVAAWIGHPIIRQPLLLDRVLQYQHEPSGGVFHYIGDDPQQPQWPATIGSLNTTFFGQLMLALDIRDRAIAAGEWVRRWVDANRPFMGQGILYTLMTPDGQLVTEAAPGERLARVVETRLPKQEFWNVGTAMAYLADLYDAMRLGWGYDEATARPYLDAALVLLDFEDTMPLDTYLWPSKCKVAWGAGELLRVLVQHSQGAAEQIEKAYRAAERTAVFTFLGNQLAHGGWSCMHYPLNECAPEMSFSYTPLNDLVWVPEARIEGSATIFLPAEEITGEFLGEMKSVEQGVQAWLERGGV